MLLMSKLKKILSLTALVLLLQASPCLAVTKVDITHTKIKPIILGIQVTMGKLDKLPIGQGKNIQKEFKETIRADLNSCGLFDALTESIDIESLAAEQSQPTYSLWKSLGIEALVSTRLEHSEGRFSLHAKFWDIDQRKLLAHWKVSASSIRTLAHKTADRLYEKRTGAPGYFNTKIAYVEARGRKDDIRRRLAIVDQDGANLSYATDGKSIVLTPRFAKDGKSMLYFAYQGIRSPTVKLYDFASKRSQFLQSFEGMSFSPRFTSKRAEALLSIERQGISNIYSYNLETLELKKITNCYSICTSATSSPDGKKIVYNSDVSGSKHLYVMNSDGSKPTRISRGDASYSTPVWSPKGDLIAFTKMTPGEGFSIGIMAPDGSNERVIATGYMVEGPEWAPNGRAIIFERQDSRHNNITKLYKIDLYSRTSVQLQTAYSAGDATWVAHSD